MLQILTNPDLLTYQCYRVLLCLHQYALKLLRLHPLTYNYVLIRVACCFARMPGLSRIIDISKSNTCTNASFRLSVHAKIGGH